MLSLGGARSGERNAGVILDGGVGGSLLVLAPSDAGAESDDGEQEDGGRSYANPDCER